MCFLVPKISITYASVCILMHYMKMPAMMIHHEMYEYPFISLFSIFQFLLFVFLYFFLSLFSKLLHFLCTVYVFLCITNKSLYASPIFFLIRKKIEYCILDKRLIIARSIFLIELHVFFCCAKY